MSIAENIKGFDKLNDRHADMFKAFLNNFYNTLGKKTRAAFTPLEIRYKKDKENGAYLRFDYIKNGHKEWLHVKSAIVWY